MEPKISEIYNEESILTFTLSGVNHSLANAIRRIILSEIPCVVFKTSPYSENKVDITINTTRMNNELIKQRISCVPVFIDPAAININELVIEVDKKNTSDIIEYVTTEDFKIKNKETGKYLSDIETRKIFPPDPITGDYIDIVRLRPGISTDIVGEHLKFTATLIVSNAKDNGSFSVASTCSYSNTKDKLKIKREWDTVEKKLKAEKISASDIAFRKKDWMLLEAQKLFIDDSFDFIIESIGQYSNIELVYKACGVMVKKLEDFIKQLELEDDSINPTKTTIENSYDITLKNEDYTLGKAIEFVLFTKYFASKDKLLSFCGFRKLHPHDSDSIIRLGFVNPTDKPVVSDLIKNSALDLISIFQNISKYFE